MELDELKTVWASVDERLKKQEILKESIIKEMLSSKLDKSYKKLFWDEGISIMASLLLIPFIVYVYGKFGGKHIWWDSTVIFAGVFIVVYFPYLLYKTYLLYKIDISEILKNNLFYINRYRTLIKREKIFMVILIPIMFILICLAYIEAKANISLWVFMICGIILTILYGYWWYNKFYANNIQSIKNSLEELQELKEE